MDRNVETPVEEIVLFHKWIRQFFAEALRHCRHKTKLFNFLQTIQLSDFADKNLVQIFTDVSRRIDEVHGLGSLATYDITAAICRHYQLAIGKVYLVGDGPKRAVALLGMKKKVDPYLQLEYVDIQDVVIAFDKKGYKLEDQYRTTQDGDLIESYLCCWQNPIDTQLDLANLLD